MAKTFTVQDFYTRFPDDSACLDHLMKLRFGDELDCPKCGRYAKFYRIKKMPAYACEWCGHHIHPMAGTFFKRSHTALQKWFYAMYLFTTTRHGVPARELQRQLGVTLKTAWRMGHEIRKHMAKVDGNKPLDGHVEVDETYVGGHRPGKRGRGAEGKTIVFGMVERGGDLQTHVVPNVKRETLEPLILKNVEAGSQISSDEWGAYNQLSGKGYDHGTVDHGKEEWVNGNTHVNTLEGFWSQLKRSISGTHVHVSKKHLAKYLGEFEFRFNLRNSEADMFPRLLASL